MKFIEDICSSIVSPPKLRYSTYDLGMRFITKVVPLLRMAEDMISLFSILKVWKFRRAITKAIKKVVKRYVWCIYTAWMDLAFKVRIFLIRYCLLRIYTQNGIILLQFWFHWMWQLLRLHYFFWRQLKKWCICSNWEPMLKVQCLKNYTLGTIYGSIICP